MAVDNNASTEKVVGKDLYTGVFPFKVIAINPNKKQMEDMGMNPQNDPQYVDKSDDGNTRVRLDFVLESLPTKDTKTEKMIQPFKTKVAFWIENAKRENQNGDKDQYINKYGMTAWAEKDLEAPPYDWYSTEGLRKAYIGEETLIEFIKTWANVKRDGECSLDTIKKITSEGDVTELKQMVKLMQSNVVKLLVGVNSTEKGDYQTVYTKYFERPYTKNLNGFVKKLEDQYGNFKGDYQNDLHPRLYEGKSDISNENKPDAMEITEGAEPDF